ncbi:MAG: hypothetical protein ABWZ30_01040 [Jiangellaceae bacterium]
MARINKYLYSFVVQGVYNGWEDLTAETTLPEARKRRREYRDNEGGTYRIVKRREPNPAYVGAE